MPVADGYTESVSELGNTPCRGEMEGDEEMTLLLLGKRNPYYRDILVVKGSKGRRSSYWLFERIGPATLRRAALRIAHADHYVLSRITQSLGGVADGRKLSAISNADMGAYLIHAILGQLCDWHVIAKTLMLFFFVWRMK